MAHQALHVGWDKGTGVILNRQQQGVAAVARQDERHRRVLVEIYFPRGPGATERAKGITEGLPLEDIVEIEERGIARNLAARADAIRGAVLDLAQRDPLLAQGAQPHHDRRSLVERRSNRKGVNVGPDAVGRSRHPVAHGLGRAEEHIGGIAVAVGDEGPRAKQHDIHGQAVGLRKGSDGGALFGVQMSAQLTGGKTGRLTRFRRGQGQGGRFVDALQSRPPVGIGGLHGFIPEPGGIVSECERRIRRDRRFARIACEDLSKEQVHRTAIDDDVVDRPDQHEITIAQMEDGNSHERHLGEIESPCAIFREINLYRPVLIFRRQAPQIFETAGQVDPCMDILARLGRIFAQEGGPEDGVPIQGGLPARHEAIRVEALPKAADDLLYIAAGTGMGDSLEEHPLLRGRQGAYAPFGTIHRCRCP